MRRLHAPASSPAPRAQPLRPAAPVLLAALLALAPAAQAGVVGRVSQEGLEVVINDTRDWCPEGALSALWVQPELRLRGCYLERDGMLFMVWEDGDRHVVKRSVFTARMI